MSTDAPETGETTTTYDEAIAAGWWGTHPDPAGNEPYTLDGVSAGGEEPVAASKSSGSSSSKSSSSKSDA